MSARDVLITTAAALVIIAAVAIIADLFQLLPTKNDAKHQKSAIPLAGNQEADKPQTWRLFIVPTHEINACPLSDSKLRAAIEVKFQIQLGSSKLVLSRETNQYCATLSFQGTKSPFKRGEKFTLEIATNQEEKATFEVTPDDIFLHITTLYDGTGGKKNAVDIVVVPGLASHPYGSFKSPQNPTENWLRDYLPQRLPHLRILVYGYDSNLVDRESKEGIEEYATKLLNAVYLYREDRVTSQRPVVFLGHSLGGLIIKQALVLANTNSDEKDRALLKSCYGFLFFGVPNRGLRHEELTAILGDMPAGELVTSLVVDKDSEPKALLKQLGKNFIASFSGRKHKVVAFYETKGSPTVEMDRDGNWVRSGKKKLMVTEDSATFIDGIYRIRDKVPLSANHSTMVKYDTEHDEKYLAVQQQIVKMVEDAVDAVKAAFSNMTELSQSQAKILADFKRMTPMELVTRDVIANAYPNTLEWFLNDQRFEQWRSFPATSPILWICGPPGKGKSVLAKFLTTHLEQRSEDHAQKAAVVSFFCDAQDPRFRDPASILLQLILQLVDCEEAYTVIPDELWNERSKFSETSLGLLWELFSILLDQSHRQRVYCLIDALDECREGPGQGHKYQRESQRSELLRKLVALFSQHSDRLRLLITSRPDETDIVLYLEKYKYDLIAQESDLEIFIESELENLPQPDFTEDLRVAIRKKLLARAGTTFLWLSIVMRELASLNMPSLHQVENTLNSIPLELNKMYYELLQRLAERDSKLVKILIWVAYATRPLTITELQDALTFDQLSNQHHRLSEMEHHRPSLDAKSITTKLGSFLSVTYTPGYRYPGDFSIVSFQHQSAKDFFDYNRDSTLFRHSIGIEPDLYIGRTCLYYLTSDEFENRSEFHSGAISHRTTHIRKYYESHARYRGEPTESDYEPTESVYDERPFSFLQYVGTSWYKHIRTRLQAEVEEDNSMIKRILDKNNQFLLVWTNTPLLSERYFNFSSSGLRFEPFLNQDRSLARIAIDFEINWLAEQIFDGEYPGESFSQYQLMEIAKVLPQTFKWMYIERVKRLPHDLLVYLSRGGLTYSTSIEGLVRYQHIELKVIGEALEAMLKMMSFRSDYKLVQLLLNRAPNVTITDTHVRYAIRCRNEDVVKLLLNQAKNNTITHNSIQCAVREANRGIILFLLDKFPDSITTDSCIQCAIQYRDEVIIKLLLDKAPDITITDSCIQCAIKNGNEGIIRLLLDTAPNVTITDDQLRCAVQQGNGQILELLLRQTHCNIAILDELIDIALGCSNREKSDNVMRLLLNICHAESHVRQKHLVYAAQQGYFMIIRRLLTLSGQDEKVMQSLITENVVIAILKSCSLAWVRHHDINGVMGYIGQARIHFSISEETAVLAAQNLRSFQVPAMDQILKMRAPGLSISEDLITAAASNKSRGWGILKFLFSRDPSVAFTDNAMRALFGNELQGQHTLEELVYSHPHRIRIADSTTLEALKERWPNLFTTLSTSKALRLTMPLDISV